MQEAYCLPSNKCSLCCSVLEGQAVPHPNIARGYPILTWSRRGYPSPVLTRGKDTPTPFWPVRGCPMLWYPPARTGFTTPERTWERTWDWDTPWKGPGKEPATWGTTPRKDLGPVTWERTCDWGTPRCGQTHTYENSTFPILQMRAVITSK